MTSEMSLLIYSSSITDCGKTWPCVFLADLFLSSQIMTFLAASEYHLLLGQFSVNVKLLSWYCPGSYDSVVILS